jgi:hypothetical protein
MTERFTLLTELGRGGMGVVWKARDEETGRVVALKLLREAYAEDPEYLARFERELELARRIDSVHVVKVLGFGVRDKLPYLALEYVDGPSLHNALVAHGPYSWSETKALLIQLTQGLADANAAGVIHRDVKPSNVLLGPDGVAKLTDFGIARGLDLTRMTATSTLLGTPAYMAPEGPKDARSDLYSLGIIGYELLTGAVPFKGTSYQEVVVDHIRTPPDLSKLPPESRDIVGWLLEKDPAARPQRASELPPVLYGAALAPGETPVARAADHPPAPAKPTSARQQSAPVGGSVAAPIGDSLAATARRRSTPLIFGLAAVGLVACLVAVVLAGGFLSSKTGTHTQTGTFSPTGSMSTFHGFGHTATVLSDGRVLIAGSSGDAAAELYDPNTGTFSPTGSMTTGRSYHTATPLSDGRVLIAGGLGGLVSAELYDLKTGTFSPTGSMTTGRGGHTATLLHDGRVLVAGGDDSTNQPVASAELYDPKTGTFSPTGSMTNARQEATASQLLDGHVLVAGGWGSSGDLASAELYDPKTGTFSPTGSMTNARQDATASLLSDGHVLVAGGHTDSGGLASAEIYTP